MSTIFYGPAQVRINFGASNNLLAHLQVATSHRFAEGRGYFLTLSGSSDDGDETSVSYWLHPSIPLLFSYDTENDEGDRPAQVDIDAATVDTIVGVMDRPLGVIWGYAPDEGRYTPFYEPQPDSDAHE